MCQLTFINCRIPPDLKIKIKKLAIDNNMSVQDLCKELFEMGLAEFEKKH
jgi:hypothetical protein